VRHRSRRRHETDAFQARADEFAVLVSASQAAEHFRAAIAIDPRFAQAHASLAQTTPGPGTSPARPYSYAGLSEAFRRNGLAWPWPDSTAQKR
jgi:hypothetical protein